MRVALVEMAHQPGDIRQRRALSGAGTTRDVIDMGVAHAKPGAQPPELFQGRCAAARQQLSKVDGRIAGVMDQHPLYQRFHGYAATPGQAKRGVVLQDGGSYIANADGSLEGDFFRQQTLRDAGRQQQLAEVARRKGAVAQLRNPLFTGRKIDQQTCGLPFFERRRGCEAGLQQADDPLKVGVTPAAFDQHDIAVA